MFAGLEQSKSFSLSTCSHSDNYYAISSRSPPMLRLASVVAPRHLLRSSFLPASCISPLSSPPKAIVNLASRRIISATGTVGCRADATRPPNHLRAHLGVRAAFDSHIRDQRSSFLSSPSVSVHSHASSDVRCFSSTRDAFDPAGSTRLEGDDDVVTRRRFGVSQKSFRGNVTLPAETEGGASPGISPNGRGNANRIASRVYPSKDGKYVHKGNAAGGSYEGGERRISQGRERASATQGSSSAWRTRFARAAPPRTEARASGGGLERAAGSSIPGNRGQARVADRKASTLKTGWQGRPQSERRQTDGQQGRKMLGGPGSESKVWRKREVATIGTGSPVKKREKDEGTRKQAILREGGRRSDAAPAVYAARFPWEDESGVAEKEEVEEDETDEDEGEGTAGAGWLSAAGDGEAVDEEIEEGDYGVEGIGWLNSEEPERRRKREPFAAELILSPEEIKRVRGVSLTVRQKVKVGRMGVTQGVVDSIRGGWRGGEIVKVRCEGDAASNMRKTHEELERMTGGLVIWRSGGVAAIYRGADYDPTAPVASTPPLHSPSTLGSRGRATDSATAPAMSDEADADARAEEEEEEEEAGQPRLAAAMEEDLTEGLGPKAEAWDRPGPVPVDGDLLCDQYASSPSSRFSRPYRLLPYGVSAKLTNHEMTRLRKDARKLPSHFVLSKQKGLEGLADAMVKLWDRCECAKISVRRGIQNTANERMSEELKRLTGGVLLSRDKFYIVFYRGKDFLPTAVALALQQRAAMAKQNADAEERQRLLVSPRLQMPPNSASMGGPGRALEDKTGLVSPVSEPTTQQEENEDAAADAGSSSRSSVQELAALRANWDSFWNSEENKRRRESAAKAKRAEAVRMAERKLHATLMKKEKAERELAKVNASLRPVGPPDDRETITEEERYMFRRLGLKMKAYLEMGKRGVFGGTVENMHLHWKHRELVKVICKEKERAVVDDMARQLEWESGGIWVATIPASRGFHYLLYYRGKNYTRPTEIRPRHLLSKRQALKKATEEQRRRSLEQHMAALEKNIRELRKGLAAAEQEAKANESPSDSDLEAFRRMSHGGNVGRINMNGMQIAWNGSGVGSVTGFQSIQIESLSGSGQADQSFSVGGANGESLTSVEERGGMQFESSAYTPAKGRGELDMDHLENLLALHADTEADAERQRRKKAEKRDLGQAAREERAAMIRAAEEGVLFRAGPLSARERLLLRRRALQMSKRATFEVGKGNVVSGLARAIRIHFTTNSLVKVGVKGRASGTPVPEIARLLEATTGGVLVSREPNKIILYRGWPDGEKVPSPTSGQEQKEVGSNALEEELLQAMREEDGVVADGEDGMIDGEDGWWGGRSDPGYWSDYEGSSSEEEGEIEEDETEKEGEGESWEDQFGDDAGGKGDGSEGSGREG